MRLLIYLPDYLGDLIAATPLLRLLKVNMEDADIHAIALPANEMVLTDNPYVDKVINPKQVFNALRKNHYQYFIDLQGNFLWRWVARLLHVKVLQYSSGWVKEWQLTKLKIDKLSTSHITDRMIALLQPLNIKEDDLGLDFFIPNKDTVPPEWLPPHFQEEYILFSISAPYATRKLPTSRMIELCDKINKPVILVGERDDIDSAQQISNFFHRDEKDPSWEEGLSKLNKKTLIFNGCAKFNVNQIASLAKQSTAVFCFDSEMVSIASAFKKPIYLVLGNTVTMSGRYPYHTRFVILENNQVSCRPCSFKGYDSCPKKHFNCMDTITFDFYLP